MTQLGDPLLPQGSLDGKEGRQDGRMACRCQPQSQGPPRRTLHSGLRPSCQAAQGPGLSTASLRAKLQTSSFTSRNLFPRSPGGGTAKVKVRTGLLLPRPLSLAAGGCPFSVSSGPFPGRVCVPTSWMRTSAGWDQGHPCFAFVPSARPCAQVQPYGGGSGLQHQIWGGTGQPTPQGASFLGDRKRRPHLRGQEHINQEGVRQRLDQNLFWKASQEVSAWQSPGG